jgi:hypothetical protein
LAATVALKLLPAVVLLGMLTVKDAAPAALTMTGVLEPVIKAVTVSVAVIV